jgi:hypothetical protein
VRIKLAQDFNRPRGLPHCCLTSGGGRPSRKRRDPGGVNRPPRRSLFVAVGRNEEVVEGLSGGLAQAACVDKDNDLMCAVQATPGVGLVSGKVSIVPPGFTAREVAFPLNPEAEATSGAAWVERHRVDGQHRLKKVRPEHSPA